MSDKPKIAFYWGAACGGCEVSLLDTNEKIVEIGNVADIVLMPLATDGKYSDVEALPDAAIDVCFFNGAVRNTEGEHMAKLLRRKSKIMIAYGACASLGGVPGLANQFQAGAILKRVYETTDSTVNPGGVRPQTTTRVPEGEIELPEFFDRVYSLDQVVTVDYYLPGCPPVAEWAAKAVDAVVSGQLPGKGTVIGVEKTVCDECPRTKNSDRKLKKFYRPHEIIPKPEQCLLEQGIVCSGPATRGGCGARCITVNMPCRGCYGPAPGVVDQGAKMLSAVASMINETDEAAIKNIVADIKDPMGLFYQLSLPSSLLKEAIRKRE